MADLGAIGYRPDVSSGKNLPFPGYARTTHKEIAPQNGVIAGVVTELATPLQHVCVALVWRPTMALIRRTWTDANGEWSIGGLNTAWKDNYAVIIQDLDTGDVYNDAIYALVEPVVP